MVKVKELIGVHKVAISIAVFVVAAGIVTFAYAQNVMTSAKAPVITVGTNTDTPPTTPPTVPPVVAPATDTSTNTPDEAYVAPPKKAVTVSATTTPTPITPVVTPTPPAPIYYTVTRTGAYYYTPAMVETGVAATDPATFTRTGNVFVTQTKTGDYTGWTGVPSTYSNLNDLYYQINFSGNPSFLQVDTQLKDMGQTIDFYVGTGLAIQWVLVEDVASPGTSFYVTKQFNLPADYLWNTGTYGQVHGGPYVFDPVDIAQN